MCRVAASHSLCARTVIDARLGVDPDFDLPTPREADLCAAAEYSGELRDQLRVKANNQKREPEENANTNGSCWLNGVS